jgi:hypothetical protein
MQPKGLCFEEAAVETVHDSWAELTKVVLGDDGLGTGSVSRVPAGHERVSLVYIVGYTMLGYFAGPALACCCTADPPLDPEEKGTAAAAARAQAARSAG